MKRISYIILFAVAFLLVACTKRPELKVYKLEFVTETVEKTNSTAKMTVEYSYPTELESVKVILSENSDLGGAVSKEASITEKTFVAEFNDLKQGTKYHYCYEYSNGISLLKTDVKSFETDDVEVALPSVNTVEVKEVMSMSAVAVGNVSSDGGSVITSRGFCWSKTANPTVQNYCVEVSGTTGAFEGSLTGLEANTKYHVRAYAVNSKGTSYGEDMTFTTTQGLPVVVTSSVTEITATSAKCGGNVTDQGASNVTERGICWSTDNNPTVNDSHVSSGSGTGTYTCSMTDLMPEEIYYVRAYAKNAQGISYGDEVNFTALEGLPTVTTSMVTNITSTTATCGGNVTNQGASNVTERGVCWSTSPNPMVSNSHTTDGSGTGSFTSNITGLTQNTTYYVRAYATNSKGTSYGEQESFTARWRFSVSPSTTVEFAPGNLYWDGSVFKFEANQWSSASAWNASHVSHFKWSDAANAVTGNDSFSGYLFCASNFTVAGDSHTDWRTLSRAEWEYLLGTGSSYRTNAKNLRAWVTLTDVNVFGLVILPDGSTVTASSVTTTTAVASSGAVFLPAAGRRYGTDVGNVGSGGGCWSSTPGGSSNACYMYFNSGGVGMYGSYRSYGFSVRLVR